MLHFVNHAYEITFAGTSARMSQVGYFATMTLFLITATFHGVNGVYNALVNQGLDGQTKDARSNGCSWSPALRCSSRESVALAMTGMS